MTNYNDTFSVLIGGGVDSLDGIASALLSNNDFAFGMVNGLYHPYYYDSSSSAAENSPYTIAPDDIGGGDGRWILGGFQGAFSHIRSNQSSGQSIPDNTATTIIFGTEEKDTLGEYNPATGIFTAKYSGEYSFKSIVSSNSSAVWVEGESLFLRLIVNGVTEETTYVAAPRSGTYRLQANPISKSVYMAAAQTALIQMQQQTGVTISLQSTSSYNFLTIDRIA